MVSSFESPRSTLSSQGATVVTDNAGAYAVSRGFASRPKHRASGISPWFVSREVDVLFVCGLAPWLIGIACFFITGAGGAYSPTKFPQQVLTALFVVCSLVIGESHQFTSIVRYYSSFRKRTKSYKWQRIPFWILYAFVAELVLESILGQQQASFLQWTFPWLSIILQFLIMAFPAVLMQHVCAQALAIVQQYCRMGDYNISKMEKSVLAGFSWLLTATGVVSIAVPFGFSSQIDSNQSASTALSAMMNSLMPLSLGAGLLIGAYMIFRGVTKKQWPPLGAILLLSNLVALILLTVPLPAMAYVWLFVPLFFHATQHWALAWRTHQRESVTKPSTSMTPKEYCNQICAFVMPILGLTLLVLFLPLFLRLLPPNSFQIDSLFGAQTLSVFLSMLVFYVHYFADRVVWRPKS